jgi:hypothetical protein
MRRSGRVGLAAAIAVAVAAFACNALNGAGDFTFAPPCEGCGEGDGRGDDGAADGMAVLEAAADGGGADAKVDVIAPRPPFCSGIVMYARFDNALTTAQGVAPEAPPVTSFVPGRFGTGVLLTAASGPIYYVQGDGGVPYPRSEGTMAMWVKPQWTWPSTLDRVLWKPTADRTTNANSAGPHMRTVTAAPGFFGSSNSEPTPPGGFIDVGGTPAELAPFWKVDWNHIVETWSQASPTITFTLNGATGDPTLTHRETDAGWAPQFPTVAYVRLSSTSFPADSAYDDVALWSRALSLAEIEAVYAADKPLGDLCGL